jgi:hypothetical protein
MLTSELRKTAHNLKIGTAVLRMYIMDMVQNDILTAENQLKLWSFCTF